VCLSHSGFDAVKAQLLKAVIHLGASERQGSFRLLQTLSRGPHCIGLPANQKPVPQNGKASIPYHRVRRTSARARTCLAANLNDGGDNDRHIRMQAHLHTMLAQFLDRLGQNDLAPIYLLTQASPQLSSNVG